MAVVDKHMAVAMAAPAAAMAVLAAAPVATVAVAVRVVCSRGVHTWGR